MASVLKVNTLTGVTTAGSIAVTGEGNSTTTNLQQGLAKSWLNLTGTGTIALKDSFNVASMVDNGTGDYTSNFTNALNNDDFCCVGNAGDTVSDPSDPHAASIPVNTSSARMRIYSSGTAAQDKAYFGLMVTGDLA